MWFMSTYKSRKIFYQHSGTSSSITIGILTQRWQRSKSLSSSSFVLFFSCRSPTPWSSFLIKDSQVRGWRVNIGVRAWISMGGNELFHARSPNLLHVSLREAGKRGGRKMEMQSKLGAGVFSLFLFPLGQRFQAMGKVFNNISLFCILPRVWRSSCRPDQYYRRIFSPSSEARL